VLYTKTNQQLHFDFRYSVRMLHTILLVLPESGWWNRCITYLVYII